MRKQLLTLAAVGSLALGSTMTFAESGTGATSHTSVRKNYDMSAGVDSNIYASKTAKAVIENRSMDENKEVIGGGRKGGDF